MHTSTLNNTDGGGGGGPDSMISVVLVPVI